MAKFLVEARYTKEGVQGLLKDSASARKAAVAAALESIGGKLEAFYYAFGETDVFVLCDCPDNATAAAIGLTVSSSGTVQTKTVALLSVEEMDAALKKQVRYRPAGA
jgi:uncharacterized protein with GYD domain